MSHDTAAQITFSRPSALAGSDLMRARDCAYAWREVPLTYELCLVEQGGAEWWSGSRTYVSRGGSVCIIPPGELHRALRVAARSSFRVVSLPPDLIAGLDERLLHLGAGQRQLDVPTLSRSVQRLFSQLELEREALGAESALLEVGAACLPRSPLDDAVRAPLRARRMREFLHANYAARISLLELAEQAGLPKLQALRAFQRSYGVPPLQYLMLLRVSQAKRLLARGTALAAVASQTGFADQSHLSRWFKQLYLIAPGEYARSLSPRTRRSARAWTPRSL